MRLIGILALVLGVVLGGVGLIGSYTFEKDPLGRGEASAGSRRGAGK